MATNPSTCPHCRQRAVLYDLGLCRPCLQDWSVFRDRLARVDPDRAARVTLYRSRAEQRSPLFASAEKSAA